MQRMGRSGQLTIDGGLEFATNNSRGNFTLLNVNSGYLFVGGVPTTYLPQVTRTLGPASVLASLLDAFSNLSACRFHLHCWHVFLPYPLMEFLRT